MRTFLPIIIEYFYLIFHICHGYGIVNKLPIIEPYSFESNGLFGVHRRFGRRSGSSQLFLDKKSNAEPLIINSNIEKEKEDDEGRYIGKHKWLGGAVDSLDGCIYGIPAHSSNVLCLEPDEEDGNYSVHLFPLPKEFHGIHFKWLRGIIQGPYLYGIPAWATSGVLRVDLPRWKQFRQNPDNIEDIDSIVHVIPLPENKELKEDQNRDPIRWQWHGAALNSNTTAIYAIPCNTKKVLKVDIETQTTTYLPIPSNENGDNQNDLTNKWYGGILGWDNAIYGIPYAASGILRIDANTDQVSILGNYGAKQYNWHGGLLSQINGAIYAFPAHSMQVLKIDTVKNGLQTLLTIQRAPYDNDNVTRYKWLGGSIGADECVYGMPSDASSILRIDPRTDKVTTISYTNNAKNKWQGGVLSPKDGCIYAIPSNELHVLRIDTNYSESDQYQQISLIGPLPKKKDKWQGGFIGKDNNIYCVPENFDRIMKITPGSEPLLEYLK